MKTIREYIDQLDEISRRDFLKGAGAAAGLAATDAIGRPFQHGQTKDELENKLTGKYSTVKSDDGDANLFIIWNKAVSLTVPGRSFEFDDFVMGSLPASSGRIKFGSNPAEQMAGVLSKDYKTITLLTDLNPSSLANKIMRYSGLLKIEVHLSRVGSKIFSFTIEQDLVTKQYEEQLEETSDDPIAKIDALFRDK